MNNDQVINNYESLPSQVLSPEDPGDDVQLRFRYQHTYTALVAVQMYSGRLPYNELYCEQHEDILAIREDGMFEGIQVKTRQIDLGPFENTDDAIVNSLARFIKLDIKFPGKFSKFVIVSNCPFRDDQTGKSLCYLLSQVKAKRNVQYSPKTLNSYLHLLCQKSNATLDQVLDTLCLTELQLGPGLSDIDSKVINDHLGRLAICGDITIAKIRLIHQILCNRIFLASSKYIEDAVGDYAALANGIVSVNAAEINSKRITKDVISKLINSSKTGEIFLKHRAGSDIVFSSTSQLMRYKMASGFIDDDAIDVMDDLRASAEEYFIEKSYKVEDRQSVVNQYQQIRKIVTNQAIEAKSRHKKDDGPYGTDMLHSIENRLSDISKTRKEDVFNSPYEILKGLVGVLTNECKVAFSKVPEGGWTKNEKIPH